MIIQSIRLKNIKSYGNGLNGDGVLIPFERGVNRIAGRNGHGKTTLIESIGYALFLTEPQFEENFHIETYFLSHGSNEGEIDITFESEGISYRIERAVGNQSKRRAKVVQMSDQSICAEGDAEVSDFICRLLGIPNPKNLNEIFCKLVGVKQGRLTWPFDSKPAEAKRYFEPLMEVEVFRNCFDQLRGVVDIFENQRNEHNVKLAGINERIQERADSEQKLAQSREKVGNITITLAAANQACEMARKLAAEMEELSNAVGNAGKEKELANQKAKHSKQLRETAETQLAESTNAAKVLTANEKAHKDYAQAVQKLSDLEKQRNLRDDLKQLRDKAEKGRAASQAAASSAREQSKLFASQQQKTQRGFDELSVKVKPVKESLDKTADKFKKSSTDAETAYEHRETLVVWAEGLKGIGRSQKKLADNITKLSKEVSSWDEAKVKNAVKQEEELAEALKAAQKKLAKAEERQQTLNEQLEEISGGVCPFLKEKCRQFDPAKVKADLEKQAETILKLKEEVGNAQSAHKKCERLLAGLREAKGKITGKESELEEDLNDYRERLLELLTNEADQAQRWLTQWEKLPPLPSVFKVPGKKLGLAQVSDLQKELGQYLEDVESWWDKAVAVIERKIEGFEEEKEKRNNQLATLEKDTEHLHMLKVEAKDLGEKSVLKELEAKNHDSQAAGLVEQIAKFDQDLSMHTSLDSDIKKQQALRDEKKEGYERYVGAKKLADELPACQERVKQLKTDEDNAVAALQTAIETLAKAEQSFDLEKLKAAKADHLSKRDQVTILTANLENEKRVFKQEEKRFEELQQAKKEQEQVSNELARCRAAIAITELSRTTLRDAAPAVAQHLCNRIADRAQSVFNQINPDPVKLEWDAQRYSLRVTPGERRFAMLSGGEQTMLALSVTLAMIEEFSRLRFCIFDEPTYSVDADSRHKLADAILQAQEAANLDQLLLVSHDDAFEGKIEHAILLEKTPGKGTSLTARN